MSLVPPMNEAKRLVDLIPRLRRYARALVGDRATADDLVQDTLERAWAKLHLYRRGTDLRAWLFTVMHNVHVNRVRVAVFMISGSMAALRINVRPLATVAARSRFSVVVTLG